MDDRKCIYCIDGERGIRIHKCYTSVTGEELFSSIEHAHADTAFDPNMPSLWDMRNCELNAKFDDVMVLMERIRSLRLRCGLHSSVRSALVTNVPLTYGVVRQYITLSYKQNVPVIELFVDYVAALEWLLLREWREF